MKSDFSHLVCFLPKEIMQIKENVNLVFCYCYIRAEFISEYQNLFLFKISSFNIQAEYCTNYRGYICRNS